ncbi:MAG TPA: hypothetical protein VIH61_10035 [Waddliaceae bacterium]
MRQKGWLMLRILLNRFHEGAVEGIVKGVSPDDVKMILNQNVESKEINPILASPSDILMRIHYSWLQPELEKLPKNVVGIAISLLPQPIKTKLREAFKIKEESFNFSTPAHTFLLNRLFKHIYKDNPLPLDYLPSSPMTPLARLQKEDLIEVIDYLGLYDLAEEIRQIVHKKQIENIYSCLSNKKHLYLRQCLHQKEKLVTQGLQLERWNGDCQKLIKLLHHRGIVRLGYALSGQHPDLVWHITHLLDSGRGEKLHGYIQKEEIPGVTQALKLQVKNVIDYQTKAGKG